MPRAALGAGRVAYPRTTVGGGIPGCHPKLRAPAARRVPVAGSAVAQKGKQAGEGRGALLEEEAAPAVEVENHEDALFPKPNFELTNDTLDPLEGIMMQGARMHVPHPPSSPHPAGRVDAHACSNSLHHRKFNRRQCRG